MGKRVTGTEQAHKGLRTGDIVPLADTEKKKARRKKLTPEERIALWEGKLSAAKKAEETRQKTHAEQEARKKSRELLKRVKDAWPKIPAWNQQSCTEWVEKAVNAAPRPGGEIPVKEEVMASS